MRGACRRMCPTSTRIRNPFRGSWLVARDSWLLCVSRVVAILRYMLARKTRKVRRTGVVLEDRCVICGIWSVRQGSRPRVTCSPAHRVALVRAKQALDK